MNLAYEKCEITEGDMVLFANTTDDGELSIPLDKWNEMDCPALVYITTRPTFKFGDRVRVTDSLLYKGCTGYLVPNSGDPEDPWDFCVILGMENADPKHRGRKISVHTMNIEHV